MSITINAKYVYAFYKVHKIEPFKVLHQMESNMVSMEKADVSPSFMINEKKSNSSYIYYDVEFDKRTNKEGYAPVLIDKKYEFKPFEYYFQQNRFSAIKKKDTNYVLFNTSYKNSDSFLNYVGALTKNEFGIKNNLCDGKLLLSKINVDLDKIVQSYETIGAWHEFENQSNVRSSGTFGPNVVKSDIYTFNEERDGKLKSLTVKYRKNGLDYSVIISQNGTIAIMNKTTEVESLEIVEEFLSIIL